MAAQSLKDGLQNDLLVERLRIKDSTVDAYKKIKVSSDSLSRSIASERRIVESQVITQSRIIKETEEVINNQNETIKELDKEKRKLARKLKTTKVLSRIRLLAEIAAAYLIISNI